MWIREADLDVMAEQIVFNAKCQRPSACNAAETLLVHRAIASRFLPCGQLRLATKNVEFHADTDSPASGEVWGGKPDFGGSPWCRERISRPSTMTT